MKRIVLFARVACRRMLGRTRRHRATAQHDVTTGEDGGTIDSGEPMLSRTYGGVSDPTGRRVHGLTTAFYHEVFKWLKIQSASRLRQWRFARPQHVGRTDPRARQRRRGRSRPSVAVVAVELPGLDGRCRPCLRRNRASIQNDGGTDYVNVKDKHPTITLRISRGIPN